MLFKKKIKKEKEKGFSLVELIVVIGIFAVISGIVLFNYGRFSSNLVVTNLAYQAALAVREAQVYGISVKQTKTGNKFDASYGVWFNQSSNQNFYLFADKTKDGKRADGMSEDEEVFGMSGTNKISSFCVFQGSTSYCSNKSNGPSSISITFARPNPNAFIYGFNAANNDIITGQSNLNNLTLFDRAEIMLTSGQGDKIARMTVYNSGQISVDSCNSPRGGNPCQL